MFLRYLIAEGKCLSGLEHALPTLAHWRLSTLPRYLPISEVERVDSGLRWSKGGRRPRPSRGSASCPGWGLRAGDIVELRLSDIDWRDASFCVLGKGGREVRLPLSQGGGRCDSQLSEASSPHPHRQSVCLGRRAP